MMREKQALLKEIERQAHYPSGGDPFIHSFFLNLLSDSDTSQTLLDLLAKAQQIRNRKKHYLTKSHAVYLPLHIINYIMIFLEHKPDYPYTYSPSLLEKSGWEHLITFVMDKYPDLFMQYMLEKDVQQNIYQRGIAVPFFVRTLLDNHRLKVADLGCSANLVWGFMTTQSDFDTIIDRTLWKSRRELLSQYSTTKLDIAEMLGVDYRYPPKTDEGIRWLLSCRHPREVKPECIENTRRLIAQYEHLPHISIKEDDFINPKLTNDYYDIITMNNTLYQLPPNKRKMAISKATGFLKHDKGLLIVQDNCYVELYGKSERLVFTDSREYFTYRTCIGGPAVQKKYGKKWMEIFRFKTTRCREVKPGKNFQEYMNKAYLT